MTFRAATVTTSAERGPLLGLAVQFVLLLALAATAGLTVAGVLAGIAYGIALCLFLITGLRRAGMPALGPANRVTLTRAVLVGGITALTVTSITRPVPLGPLVGLVGVALALDAVDGQVARRTGSTSVLGARFDMEIDAFLILLLSVVIAGEFGWWTIGIGAFRYAFAAASRVRPWLAAPLPPRFSRKVVAAVQGVVLVVVTAQLLPQAVAAVAVALALASLTWSFGRDVRWLWGIEQTRRAARAVAALPVASAMRPVVPARVTRRELRALRRDPAPVG